MAKAKTKSAANKKTSQDSSGKRPQTMGFSLSTWTASARRAKGAEARSGKRGFVFAFSKSASVGKVPATDQRVIKKSLTGHLNRWQMAAALESESETQFFQGANGPVWILKPNLATGSKESPNSSLEKNGYARFLSVHSFRA